MVTINFKLTDTDQLHLDIVRPLPLARVIEKCEEQLDSPIGGVIVVRSGKVCSKEALIEPSDTLCFYPALSGG